MAEERERAEDALAACVWFVETGDVKQWSGPTGDGRATAEAMRADLRVILRELGDWRARAEKAEAKLARIIEHAERELVRLTGKATP